MCLIAIAWQASTDYPLVVGANRDEWHERPAAPAAYWLDHPQVLAGRDLRAGGTWLGITRDGRFAALTNFRDPSERKAGVPSRGALVSDFLTGDMAPRAYLEAVRAHAARYAGFNLIAGDHESLLVLSSRNAEILPVPPGVHALSNHSLNEPWPKVRMAKSALDAALGAKMPGEPLQERIFTFLSSAARAPDSELPDTGVGLEWERVLAPALIIGARYGTRCSTVVMRAASGMTWFEERTRDTTGGVAGRVQFTLAG